jgi:hypothetical protein
MRFIACLFLASFVSQAHSADAKKNALVADSLKPSQAHHMPTSLGFMKPGL